MDFDQLLRKYLNGSISDAELERLQGLLERVPEYKVELRQILELRSLIHDDALTLNPPEDLSERTRLTIAGQFAAIQPATVPYVDEDRPRKRGPIFPFRMAATMLVTASLATVVALTPTLRQTGGPIASAIAPPSASMTAPAADPAVAADLKAYRSRNRALQARTAAVVEREIAPPSSVSEEVEIVPASASEAAAETQEIAQQTSTIEPMPLQSTDVVNQPASPYAALSREDLAIPMPEFERGPSLREDRKFTIGFTLGSGNVQDEAAPTVLMQNSYYFSFSVTSNDRVGMEMGASTFHQPTTGTSSSGDNLAAKGSFGAPQSSSASASSPGSGSLPSDKQKAAPPPETQVTYGSVFYDRRYAVTRLIDVCGRVGVGGADNALLGNVRAYAAYSPSRNVTVTLGVGGSALFKVTSKDDRSINYGVYYGVEMGF